MARQVRISTRSCGESRGGWCRWGSKEEREKVRMWEGGSVKGEVAKRGKSIKRSSA